MAASTATAVSLIFRRPAPRADVLRRPEPGGGTGFGALGWGVAPCPVGGLAGHSAVRKEVPLTSQIEGTQGTLTDLFDEEVGRKGSNTEDVEEVTNDLRAFRWLRWQLRDPQGLPISVRLLCEAHRLLLDGAHGAGRPPGDLRHSQNWIGGARPGNAAFVPPPPQQVADLLTEPERFIHAEKRALSAEMAVRLPRLLGTSAESWVRMQTAAILGRERERGEACLDHARFPRNTWECSLPSQIPR